MNPRAAARQSVLDACLILAREGFLPGTGGNVALRVDDGSFAVTPSATDYLQMTADDVCIVDLHSLKRLEGALKPSVESGLHARFLRARPDVNASVHTHQPIASAVTLLNEPIPIEDPAHRQALGPEAPVVPYAPSGTGFLARAFERTIRPDINAYLMRNHGIVCGGQTMEQAIDNLRRLESTAIAWLADKIQAQSAKTKHGPLAQRVLHLLTAHSPS
jgi:L-fuculose-phosphate aldolase